MDRMIYTAMSGAKATMTRQDALAHNLAMPCRIEAVSLLADGRLAEVYVRFDGGASFVWLTSAATLSPRTLMNAAYCAHLVDYLDIEVDPEHPDLTAHASDYQPPATTEDGRAVTHAMPMVIQ